jgi:hypothetical protein
MSRVSWNVEKISPNFCTAGTFGVLPWLVDAVFKDFLVTTYAVVARFMHLEQNVHQQLLPVDGHEISMRERIGNMIMICSLLCDCLHFYSYIYICINLIYIYTHDTKNKKKQVHVSVFVKLVCGYTLAVEHN